MIDESMKIDLTNCDREPIHMPGTIQPHGAMLICDARGETVLRVTENVAVFMERPHEVLVGLSLGEAVGETVAHDLRNAASKAGGSHVAGVLLGQPLPGAPGLFNLTVHLNANCLLIEIERATSVEDARAALDITHDTIRRISLQTEMSSIAATAVKLLRAVLGYDRVMIYRFFENGSGQVVAEARRRDLQSFAEHHFPASDIPAQARRLYLLNWIRMIGDVNYAPVPILPAMRPDQAPVDMSCAHLRSVSPVHCEYLRNMGVAASMSISIVVDGELWGLIACHHDSPKFLPLPMRVGAELFGQYFSLQMALAERRTAFVAAGVARQRLEALGNAFGPDTDVHDALRRNLSSFAELVSCDAAGLWLDGVWTDTGGMLCAEDASVFMQRVEAQALKRLWRSADLRTLLKAASLDVQIAGVMAIPVGVAGDFLVLLRREQAHDIQWAGEPTKKIVPGLSGERLTPRGSFETWREEVRGQSKPWLDEEVAVAEAVWSFLRDAIIRQNEATAEDHLRTDRRRRVLNDELNHRVKNIIALVKSIAIQTGATAKSVEDYSNLLEGRLRALAFAHDHSLGGNGGNLKILLEAEANLHRDDHNADRVIVDGPSVGLDDRAFGVIALLMHEMTTNAAKYGALSTPAGRLTISWTVVESGDCIIHWVEEGGPEVLVPSSTGFGTKLIQSTIAHDLGGSVQVNYAPEGVRGRFLVPARHLRKSNFDHVAKDDQPSVSKDLTGMKVMLVEDQALIAMDTEEMLRLLGAQSVRLLATAAGALTAVAEDEPDCVVLDFSLGDGTSEEIADDLARRKIPFVFATGYGDSVMIPERFARVPIVRKPISAPTLAEKLGQVIH